MVNILCKNLAEAFLTAVVYWFLGFGLSRKGSNSFIGDRDFLHIREEVHIEKSQVHSKSLNHDDTQ